MTIAPRTLEDLAFDQVLHALAQRCRTEPGRQRALARPFLDDRDQVERALSRVDQAQVLAQQQLTLPFGAMADVRPGIQAAAKGALLEPRDYVAVAQALFGFERTRDALEERASLAPALVEIAKGLPPLEGLARKIDRRFEADGEISDRGSSALREARDRVRGLHRSIKGRLDQLLHDETFAPKLREPYYSLRNGRYVVPILAQARAEVPGIVHNASQTGQTLFVEPEAMVGLGNDLAIAQSLVTEEERRLLQELSDDIGRRADAILEGMEAIAALDEAEAAARLAADLVLERPAIEPLDGALEIRLLRHPLLVLRGAEVVPNDVRLESPVRALVVSGPNAGGKTVTLTAVGLCALMLRAGLPIPAAPGSRLPLYQSVHSTVGDAQDLSEGLSTFSAHVSQLRDIGRLVAPGALVLIDEIAADTDPREGAALAIAVLEDFLARGAVCLVTTHLEELKALAHMDPRFVNARVGFDPRRMAPTYQLQLGAAGSSSAIEIAARMGLPDSVTERARELAKNAGGPLSKALAATEEERRLLAERSDAARRAVDEAAALKISLEREREVLDRRQKEGELQQREAMQVELQTAQTELRELLAKLRAQQSMRDALEAQKDLAGRLEREEQAVKAVKAQLARAEAPTGPAQLKVGGWVHHAGLSRDVEILELTGDEALVAVGPLKMRVPVGELSAARKGKPAAKFPAPSSRGPAAVERAKAAAPGSVSAASFRCDVRGMRADEALREVEQFLDRVFRAGEESALVLHGHGTGALKQTIREYLASSPYARSFRPGDSHEGGDGVTLVSFRS